MGSGASKPPAGSTTTSKGKPGSATSGVNLPVSTAATTGVAVLIIDPQNSFHGGGSLAVPGADEDAERIKTLLCEHADKISSVHVTLDSHQRMHIAHGVFWEDEDGKPPAPFTEITVDDVESNKWRPVNKADQEAALAYVRELEKEDRFKLCIWPEHCITGTSGHNVTAPVNDGLDAWIDRTRGAVDWLHKGQNVHTEMYSALKAEVVIESDPATKLNRGLIEQLSKCERILVCGQAKSHCVNFTVRDLIENLNWPKDQLSRVWVLEDAMSSVPGFEKAGDQFIVDMTAAGLTVTTADKAFAA